MKVFSSESYKQHAAMAAALGSVANALKVAHQPTV